MLALAGALSELADVTLAFRRVPELPPVGCRVIAIEPDRPAAGGAVDDVAARGLNPLAHLAYLRTLGAFADRWARSFDLVLEKGWRLSGVLLTAFRRHGVPGVLVENDVRRWAESLLGPRALLKCGLHLAAERLSRSHCRRVPIIAETDEMKALLVRRRGVAPDRVHVVELGVDHSLFRPLDQAEARGALGIDPDIPVLVYVGGLDAYHDLGPLLRALASAPGPLEVHVVGDGVRGPEYRRLAARSRVPVRFHGPVPHARVPLHIAASDACVAPYREDAFDDRAVPFSTLKVPEYMACARPVVSVPRGRIRRLVEPGISGILFPNEVTAWSRFLEALPPRARLAAMGRAAARAVASVSWAATAARYLAVCEREVRPMEEPARCG
jgi:D-inositol-3-phosphate glycosyltransferase